MRYLLSNRQTMLIANKYFIRGREIKRRIKSDYFESFVGACASHSRNGVSFSKIMKHQIHTGLEKDNGSLK